MRVCLSTYVFVQRSSLKKILLNTNIGGVLNSYSFERQETGSFYSTVYPAMLTDISTDLMLPLVSHISNFLLGFRVAVSPVKVYKGLRCTGENIQ